MRNHVFAYDPLEVEKKLILAEAKRLHKSKVINETQWSKIQEEYPSQLYTPSILMRIVLFITSSMGISFGTALFVLDGFDSFHFTSFLLGTALVILVEKVFIKDKHHFHSGITEAGIYIGISMMSFGLLDAAESEILLLLAGLTLTAIVALRYFDIIAFLTSIGFFAATLFYILFLLGPPFTSIIPLMFMLVFTAVYVLSLKLEKTFSSVIFNKQFLILKSVSLIIVYLSGNHFIVSELSDGLMGIDLSAPSLLPFAITYYALTLLIPLAYLVWGIKEKSISIIRIGLLTSLLTILTFHYYLFDEFTMLAASVWGIVLIGSALGFFRYLKLNRHGFTSEQLLNEDWVSSDAFAFIASQTLGVKTSDSAASDPQAFSGQGGTGGGAGSSGTW